MHSQRDPDVVNVTQQSYVIQAYTSTIVSQQNSQRKKGLIVFTEQTSTEDT